MNDRQLNSTNYPIQILMVSSGDHITGATGIVPFVYISKGSQPFYLASGSVTENGYGVYSLNGSAFDRNTLGPCAVHATGLGCDPFDTRYDVVAYNPFDANLGLTNLDAAISSRQPSGAVSVSGGTINTLTGTVTVGTNNDKTGYSLSATQSFNNTGQTTALSVSGGTVTTVSNPVIVAVSGISSDTFASGTTIPHVTLVDSLTTYTGDTPQTGDVFALLNPMINSHVYTAAALINAPVGSGGGASGVSLGQLQSELDTRNLTYTFTSGVNKNLDTNIGSRLAATGFVAGVTSSVSVSGGTITQIANPVTVGTNNDKAGYALSSTQSFNNTGQTTAFSVSGGSINSVGTVTGVVNATGTMNINFAQQITSPQVSGSVGGALLAAETQGVGKWTIVGNTLTLFRYDGQTVVRVFQFDNASSPTSRS